MRHSPLLLACLLSATTFSSSCGSGGEATADSGSASPDMRVAGNVVVTCSYPAKFTCGALSFVGMPAAQIGMDMCTRDGGTLVSVCPADGLIGCCTQSILKNCFYVGVSSTAAKLQADCMSAQGTW